MDEHLRIGACTEAVPLRREMIGQLAVVVDLAVVDDVDRVVLVGLRLRAAGDVDDGKPTRAGDDAGGGAGAAETIPEPSTALLLVLGLVAVAVRRRRGWAAS